MIRMFIVGYDELYRGKSIKFIAINTNVYFSAVHTHSVFINKHKLK